MTRYGPNLTLAIARASRDDNPRAARVAELPMPALADYIRAHLPRNPWTACIASTQATPEEAAQAGIDLSAALQRLQDALRVQPDLLKESDGR